MARQFHHSQSLLPETTATLNVGSEDLRWLEAFLRNLNVSTRATVPTPINATDATTKAYVDARLDVFSVEEADGAPSIAVPSILRFDQADGFVLTEPTTGVARLDLASVPGSVLADDAVTYAKMQNVSATDRVLGRSTAGAGDVEEITCTASGRALIDDASAAAQRTTLGLVIGTDVQAWDADLDAVAALAATAGMLSRTGAGAFTARTITGTASNISVANGTGAVGAPTIDLVDAGPGATGPIGSATVAPVVTIDAKGRVTALTSATITAGLSAATQAEMEAASSITVAATPGRTGFHPGVAKFWASWPKTATADVSYNLTSIADTGVGDWTLTIGTDFSTGEWCSFQGFEGNNQLHVSAVSQVAGTIRIITDTNGGILTDPDGNVFAGGFGDQV